MKLKDSEAMNEEMTPLARLKGLLQLDRRDIRQILFYAIFAGIVALSLPLGVQAIVNLIQGAQISTSWIILVILVTLGVAFQGTLGVMQKRILESMQQKIFTRSSFEFAYRFPKIKMKDLSNYYPPELANRFFDTITVQKGLEKIVIDFPTAALQILFGLLLLAFYHPFFIIYGLLLLGMLFILFKFTATSGLNTSLEESKQKYRVAHWIQEVARSLISFKLSGRTDLSMTRNNRLTEAYIDSREKHFKVLWLQYILLIGFKVLVTAGLLLIGGLLVLNQQMNIGQFVAAEIIIILIINSVEKIITGLETFYDILTSLEKIGQVVDKELESQEGLESITTNGLYIELDDVGFTTPDGYEILKDLSLSIRPNQTIILQGPSGSGKTTLLKLLAGLIFPTSGKLFVNDKIIESLRINSYRSMVGQVLPEQSPFEGTIRENLTFGDESISEDQITKVLHDLGLWDYVKNQPLGLETVLYPEGKQIPHTTSKKLLLAKAILDRPKLLLLKDPLEYFEPAEALNVIKYLTDPKHPWTIVVSSKNSLWDDYADDIITLQNRTFNN